MAPKEDTNMFLSRKEAAAYLNCSVSYLNQLASKDPASLPFTRVGRFAQYRRSDLDIYLDRHTIGKKG